MSTVNRQNRRRLPAFGAAVALAVMLAGTPAGAGPAAVTSAPDRSPAGPAAGGSGVRVTLITGDTVVYRKVADGHATVDVLGGGTSKLYHSRDDRKGTYLFPDVALSYVDSGVLDRELFNVTYLAENGYGDERRTTLPVIVDYGQTGFAAKTRPLSGTHPGRALESIGATGMTVDKKGAVGFWDSLTKTTKKSAVAGTGVSKVWLDRKVTAVLDQSVPQIGAPAAWAAGYDGTGATVAVLDTGIDATHPDVAGKVVEARNFTPDPSAVDGHGHGTHVASTIAGSGGRYRGVAPGARLLVGKVLDDSGSGDLSWIIDGMEWAATEGDADIVSMSLSSNDQSDGTDPLSEAVDRLTAGTGALFVVAAGNDGPNSIAAPAAAARALTVGAVDKQNRLAGFSSTGPVLGSYAVKPEITAPGVAIVAARAAGTVLGTPVDDRYTSASGTSMATPHVSGAAAILRQRHPDWNPDMLKAALVGTAADGGFTAWEQGAGRVDVARAVAQPLRVDTAAISGGERGPADPPLVRTLAYTNDGNTDLTVSIQDTILDAGGLPAPAGLVTVDRSTLTVPAGGTAAVAVTIDHTAAQVGLYNGAVVATTAGGDRVRVPVGVRNLPRLNTMTVRLVKPVDASNLDYFSPAADDNTIRWTVLRVDDQTLPWVAQLTWRGTADPNVLEATARVPDGVYAIKGHSDWYLKQGTTRRAFANVVDPEVTVSGETTTTVDLRRLVPAEVRTDRPTDIVWQTQKITRITAAGNGFGGTTLTALPEGYRFMRYPSAPVKVGTMAYRDGFILAEAQTLLRLRSGDRSATLRPVYLPYPTNHLDIFPMFRRDQSLVLATEADLKAGRDLHGRLLYLDVPDLRRETPDVCDDVGASGAVCGMALRIRAAAKAGAAGVVLTGQGAPLEFVEWMNDTFWKPYITIPVTWLDYPEARPMVEMAAGTRPVRVELAAAPEPSYEYKLWYRSTGRAPGPGVYQARSADLKRIDTSYHADTRAVPGERNQFESMHLFWPGESSSIAVTRWFYAPTRRAEYHTVTGRDVLWDDVFDRTAIQSRTIVDTRPESRTWGAAPAVPGQRRLPTMGDRIVDPCAICRQGDTLWVMPQLVEGGDTTHAFDYQSGVQSFETRLFRDGTQIPGVGRFELPAGPGRYRLEHTTVARGVVYGATVRTVWNLAVTGRPERNEVTAPYDKPRASDPAPAAWQPAIFLSYDIPLDLDNTTRAGRPLWMTVRAASGRPGGNPRLAGLDLQASFDDGRTWARPLLVLNVGDGDYRILLAQPAFDRTAGAVSLRTHAWDGNGNEVTQTVERAYGLRAGGPVHGPHREI